MSGTARVAGVGVLDAIGPLIMGLLAVLFVVALASLGTWLCRARPRTATAAAVGLGAVLLIASWDPWLGPGLGALARIGWITVLGLLAVGSAAACAWQLGLPGRRPARPIGPMALPGLAVVAVFAADVALCDGLPRGARRDVFDAAAWRTADTEDAATRIRMLADLRDRVLPGRDRAAVEAILGPADAVVGPPTWILGYDHPDVLFPIDPLLLEITFGDDGRFAALHVRQG